MPWGSPRDNDTAGLTDTTEVGGQEPVAIRENHGRKFPADYLGHEIPAQVQCLAQDTLQEFLGRARGWSGLVPCTSLSLSGF